MAKLEDLIDELVDLKVEGEPQPKQWQSIDDHALEVRKYREQVAATKAAIGQAIEAMLCR